MVFHNGVLQKYLDDEKLLHFFREIPRRTYTDKDHETNRDNASFRRKLEGGASTPTVGTSAVEEDTYLEGINQAAGGLVRITYDDAQDNDGQLPIVNVATGKRVFPSTGYIVDAILESEQLKPRFLNNLKKTRMYSGLTEKQIVDKVRSFGDKHPNHKDIGGGHPCWRLRVARLPTEMYKNMSNFFGEDATKKIVSVLTGLDLHVQDLIILDTVASGITKQSLLFRRGQWKEANTHIDNDQVQFVSRLEPETHFHQVENTYVIPGVPLGYRVDARTGKVTVTGVSTLDNTLGIRAAAGVRPTVPFRETCATWLNRLGLTDPSDAVSGASLTTSMVKSLMQKLIRYRPVEVGFYDSLGAGYDAIQWKKESAESVLVWCVLKLVYDSPPQFIPNIQTCVSGLEIAFKRIAVCSVEDAYDETVRTHTLLLGALLARASPGWFPSDAYILTVLQSALALIRSSQAVQYDATSPSPVSFEAWDRLSGRKKAAALLRHLRSFHGDMNMVDSVAAGELAFYPEEIVPARPHLMPWFHCLDQHVAPNIVAYLFRANTHTMFNNDPQRAPGSVPDKMRVFFDECTGYNPRKHDDLDMDCLRDVRHAQFLYLKLLEPKVADPLAQTTRTYVHRVRCAELAGMMGPIDLTKIKGIPCIATLDTTNPEKLVVTRKPSVRGVTDDQAESSFDEEVQREGKYRAALFFEKDKTRTLNKIPKPALRRPELYGCKVRANRFCHPDVFYDNKWVPWRDLQQWRQEYPAFDTDDIAATEGYLERTLYSLTEPYRGMFPDEWIMKLLNTFSLNERRRLMHYLTPDAASFRVAAFSRSGHTMPGSDEVSEHDPATFWALVALSRVAPFAVRPGRPFEFVVPSLAMKDHLLGLLATIGNDAGPPWEGRYYDRMERQLYDFQSSAVKRIRREMTAGQRNHIMVLPVGCGKTLIALTRAVEILGHVDYGIYTCPGSAMSTVVEEMVAMGFRVCIVVGTKTIEPEQKEHFERIGPGVAVVSYHSFLPEANTMILVEHDTIRKIKPALLAIAPNSMVFVDEVHKCLHYTKRSAAALEIARIGYESIAFTGTPILNTGGFKLLIRWLQGVGFNVNWKNFVVALNSMIVYQINLQKKIVDNVIKVPFTQEQHEEHDRLLYQRGDLFGAMRVAYEACMEKMVHKTLDLVSEGHSVFLVGQTKAQQLAMAKEILACSPDTQLVLVGKKLDGVPGAHACESINFNSRRVNNGKEPRWDVVVGNSKHNTGYNVTYACHTVKTTGNSNWADDKQIRGRTVRIDQESDTVTYHTYLAGVL